MKTLCRRHDVNDGKANDGNQAGCMGKRFAVTNRLISMSAVLIALLIFPLRVNADVPLETIEKQVNHVLDAVRNSGFQGKSDEGTVKQKIRSIADNMFDYGELSKRALGGNWKKLSDHQRKEFVELFSALLEKVYLDKITAYTNEKVVFTREDIRSGKWAEVCSDVVTDAKTIPINYRMVLKDGEWKVYDVIIVGVSLIQNYRSQFQRILTNKPPEALLEILREKAGKA
jgi:phospholipid transport system substrate-binding protein